MSEEEENIAMPNGLDDEDNDTAEITAVEDKKDESERGVLG